MCWKFFLKFLHSVKTGTKRIKENKLEKNLLGLEVKKFDF